MALPYEAGVTAGKFPPGLVTVQQLGVVVDVCDVQSALLAVAAEQAGYRGNKARNLLVTLGQQTPAEAPKTQLNVFGAVVCVMCFNKDV